MRIKKAEASGAMSRDMKDLELFSEQGEGGFLGDRDVGRDRLDLKFNAQSPQETLVCKKPLRIGVHRDWTLMETGDFGGIPDMIKMSVCQKEKGYGSLMKFP